MILDSHSAIACGPELRAIPQLCELYRSSKAQVAGDAGEAWHLDREKVSEGFSWLIWSLLEPSLEAEGKRRIAEKTPANAAWFRELRELFPESRHIHVVRDGRDVVASLLGMDWRDGATGQLFDFVRDAGAAAELWVRQVEAAREAFAASTAGHVLELRYEDMVLKPRETLGRLFDFLGEPWEEEVLNFHRNRRALAGENESSAGQVSRPLYADSIARWRRDLTPAQLRQVNAVAGPLLTELGYANQEAA